jgi:HlyD family secretion protein
MKMKTNFSLVLLAVLALASCKNKTNTVKPQFQPLTEAVYASGALYPEHEYKVIANVDGYLQDALVVEGDSIHSGQTLFKLSSHTRDAQQAASANIYKITQANSQENSPVFMDLKYRIQTAKTKVGNDSLQFVRYKNLLAQNAISKSEFERIELQYKTSSNDLNALKEQYNRLKNSTYLDLQQAESNYKVITLQQGDEQVKSYIDGLVFEIYKQVGDAIKPNEPIALVGDRNKFMAKLSVDESDFEKIKIGQIAFISMDAFPGKTYKAEVNKVFPKLNKVEQSFRVDVVFIDPLPVKIYGLNLEANIVVNEADKVLTLPKKAVLPGDTVVVMNGKEKTKVKIKRGIENMEYIQVLGGVGPESEIVISQ